MTGREWVEWVRQELEREAALDDDIEVGAFSGMAGLEVIRKDGSMRLLDLENGLKGEWRDFP